MASLLHVAIEDLYSGKLAQAERLPGIALKCTDATLADLVRREADRAADHAARIREARVHVLEPRNLWMTGILDDAERDTRQTEPGRLLDIALVGALRKAKAAEIVSDDTAIALAAALDAGDLRSVITRHREEEQDTDALLKKALVDLCDCLPVSVPSAVD